MSKKKSKVIAEFIASIDTEGLDYAILNYCNSDDVRDDDKILAGAIDAYRDIRKVIVVRLGDYGFKDE